MKLISRGGELLDGVANKFEIIPSELCIHRQRENLTGEGLSDWICPDAVTQVRVRPLEMERNRVVDHCRDAATAEVFLESIALLGPNDIEMEHRLGI